MKRLKIKSFKNWRYYLLELLVVFVGVTGAFFLNTWRENRIASSQSSNYLESIKADLRKDKQNLIENMDFLQENNRMLGKFLYNQGDDWTDDSTNVVVGSAMYLVTFSGKSSTYESMKYSGHLNLIRDFDTRTAIVSYYESFSTIAFQDELAHQWVTTQLTILFLEKMDMRKGVFIDESVYDDISFWNKFSGHLALLNQNYYAYQALLEENQKLLVLLGE